MRRMIAFLAIIATLSMLAGCGSTYKWHYYINAAYLSDSVNLSEGNDRQADTGYDWLIIDITLSNFSYNKQYPSSYDFALVVDGSYLIEPTIFLGSQYGIPQGRTVEPGSSIRFELYFLISEGLLDTHDVGFGSVNSILFEPASLTMMQGIDLEKRQ